MGRPKSYDFSDHALLRCTFMWRRGLSLLVIVGFLANQMALIPHAHDRVTMAEQKKHDATPHIHFGASGHADDDHDDHHHGHSHSALADHDEDNDQPAQSPK